MNIASKDMESLARLLRLGLEEVSHPGAENPGHVVGRPFVLVVTGEVEHLSVVGLKGRQA